MDCSCILVKQTRNVNINLKESPGDTESSFHIVAFRQNSYKSFTSIRLMKVVDQASFSIF